jgi:hypothetical protein
MFKGGMNMANSKQSRLTLIETENRQIMQTKIFDQEQISRAVELGLGASSPDQIDVIAADNASQTYREQVVEILGQG